MADNTITNYFNQTKKDATTVFDDDRRVKAVPISKNFYDDCLAQQNSKCTNLICLQPISALEMKVNDFKSKNQKIKDAIITCSSIIVEKNCEIEELNKKLASMKTINVGEATNADLSIFSEFSSDFSSNQLAGLRSIGQTQKEDSTFVSLALKSLYGEKLETLQTKTITGRSKPGTKKEKMTPEKIATLGQIFHSRLMHSTNDSAERIMREKRLNKLIKDAQINITKNLQCKTKAEEIGRRLLLSENAINDSNK